MANIYKTFLAVFMIFFLSSSFAQTQRNPVLEEVTGTWCQWCPCGHDIMASIKASMPNAIMIGYHGPPNTSSDPFSYFPGNTIISSFGFTGYPTAVIDRVSGIQSRDVWAGYMNTRNSVPATVGINIQRSFNQSTREFIATIDFTALSNLNGQYMFNVILLEDGIVWNQTGNSSCLGYADYVHKHVVRSMMNGALGQQIINGTWNQNDVISKSVNYTVPVPGAPAPDLVWDNCNVVVLVYKSGAPLASNGEIQQAIETTLISPDYVATMSSLTSDIIGSKTVPVQFDMVISNEGLLTDKYNIELQTDIPAEWTAEFTTVNGTFTSSQIDSVEVVSGDSTVVSVTLNPNGFSGAGKTNLKFTSRNNSGNQGNATSRFVTNSGINMLVIDADEDDYENYVTGSIENVYSGTYGVVSRSALLPSNVSLSGFDIVFWQGSNSTRAFYQEEVNKLQNYFDGGGNLFITGQDIGRDIFEPSGQSQFAQDFYHNYLHTNYVADVSTLFIIKGIPNDIISNGIPQFIANDIYARSLDKISPRDTNATAFLTYFNGPDVAGVRAETDNQRVVYMAVGLEQITEQAIRDTIAARSIRWLAENVVTPTQEIEVVVHRTHIDSTLGSEMVFDFEIINISQSVQTVFEVRTVNNLPANWYSSLCFGETCFAPSLDSVATTPDFNTSPLNPGDTLMTSLHVTALQNDGTANIQVQVGTFQNPEDRITLDFSATAISTSVEDENTIVKDYYLGQNYPNPFNPSTTIDFGLKKAGNVELTVYNILGNKVATLLNGIKSAGSHSVLFDASNLSSGVYFYKIISEDFVQTRKMLMLK